MEWKVKIDDLINEQGISVNDVLDYWYSKGLINSPERTKRKLSNFSWEIKAQSVTKEYPTDLKKPNLDIEDKSHLFYNKKVVITGVFENFGLRKTMAEMVKNVGGDNDTQITKKIDFVIVGENPGPVKMKKIKEYEIKTLNEIEFINLFNNTESTIKLTENKNGALSKDIEAIVKKESEKTLRNPTILKGGKQK